MNHDDPLRAYRRWQALEEEGRDEEADRAFEAVFKSTVAPAPVSLEFTATTMTAIAAAAERDARRARRVRRASMLAAVASGIAAAYVNPAPSPNPALVVHGTTTVRAWAARQTWTT